MVRLTRAVAAGMPHRVTQRGNRQRPARDWDAKQRLMEWDVPGLPRHATRAAGWAGGAAAPCTVLWGTQFGA